MALPVLDDHFRTISKFTNVGGGRPWTVTIDYVDLDKVGIPAEDVAEVIGASWFRAFDTVMSPLTAKVSDIFARTVALQSVVCYDLGGQGVGSEVAPGVPVEGTAATTDLVMPPDMALCISKRSGFRGRAGAGRFYLGGLTGQIMDAALDNGLFEPTVVAGIKDAFSAEFIDPDPSNALNLRMAIISGPTPTFNASFSRVVTNLTADVHPDVQRRRGQR